jgi:hypothetical protein
MRLAKVAMTHRPTRNRRAVQILLGQTKIEIAVRYLGVQLEGACCGRAHRDQPSL